MSIKPTKPAPPITNDGAATAATGPGDGARASQRRYDIRLGKPLIDDRTRELVLETLESGWLTEGEMTYSLQRRFVEWTGAAHAVAATSCTTGLEAVLRGYGIGPGDEVIVPAYTYPASASCATLLGATAVLVDIDPDTMVVSPEAIENAVTDRTRAFVPVSLFGAPLDYPRLRAIADRHGIKMVEDAACALGTEQGGARTGAHADAAVFSLHPRKILTTGEGGMITTSDDELAAFLRVFRNFGSEPRPGTPRGFEFSMLGTNLKLSNVQAAIGLGQFERLEEMLSARREIASWYDRLLKRVPEVTPISTLESGRHSWQSYPIRIPRRDAVRAALRELGIEVQVGSYALHAHRAFTQSPLVRLQPEYPGATIADRECLVLPIYMGLTERDTESVVGELERALNETR